MAEGTSPRDQKDEAEVSSSERAESSAMNKAFVSILNGLISVCPLEASPNQIVLVGRSPAPPSSFSVHPSSA